MLCPNCGKIYIPALMSEPGWVEKFTRWTHGRQLIQEVWPDATPIEREQFTSGICSDQCWDEFLS
jgi:hypothetical protein